MKRRVAVATTIAVIVGLVATPVLAVERTAAEVSELAADAVTNQAAREALRETTSIDGRSFDPESLLSGSDAEIRSRLITLAGIQPGAPIDADTARAEAEAILSQPEYGSSSPAGPGLLERIGRLIPDGVGDALFSWPAFIIFLLVIGTVLVLSTRSAHRQGFGETRSDPASRDDRASPEALLEAAELARRAGEFAKEIRLRFRAGMLELGHKGVIEHEGSATAGTPRRTLRSNPAREVATTFELVAYAGHEPQKADANASREGWRAILTTAERPDRG